MYKKKIFITKENININLVVGKELDIKYKKGNDLVIENINYDELEGKIYKIEAIYEDYIEINEELPNKIEKCYVYGTKIDDFHILKKDNIFSINVSATQELYKIIEEQNKIIENLINRIEELENKI